MPATVSQIAELTRRANKGNQLKNAAMNHDRIEESYRKATPDLSQIQIPPGTPVMICGGGPSLDTVLPKIQEWKGIIICTPQTYPSLKAHGRLPNFVFAMDPSIEDVMPLRGEGYGWTTLVTHPSIHPEMFEAWKGPIAYMMVNFDDGADDVFDILYPFIRFRVGAQGCVANMAFIVSGIWRCNPVVFAGVDFGWIKDKIHADYYEYLGEYKYRPRRFEIASTNLAPDFGQNLAPDPLKIPRPDIKVLGDVTTTPVNEFYHVLMLALWKGSGQACYSISEGILDMPRVSIEDAMAMRFPKPMDRADLIKYVDDRTIPYGVYGGMKDGQLVRIEFAERLINEARNDEERELGKLWHQDDSGKWHRSM